MICSSVNRDLFVRPSLLLGADSGYPWRSFRGATSARSERRCLAPTALLFNPAAKNEVPEGRGQPFQDMAGLPCQSLT